MPNGYLIDMDGVIYRGTHLIPGADRFIAELRGRDIPFSFLTNNSIRNRLDVVTHLGRLGVQVEDHHVFTCAMATARFIVRQKPGATAFVIGEGGLISALYRNGIATVENNPDYVIVGECRTLSYDAVERATNLVMAGARLIATNPDPSCPISNGTIRPGCGSIVAMIETATGRKAFSVGKPSPVMMREAHRELGLSTDEITIIGDTMETDILGGVQMGYRTILVLTGGTKREDLTSYAYCPDLVVDSIADLIPTLGSSQVARALQFRSVRPGALGMDPPHTTTDEPVTSCYSV